MTLRSEQTHRVEWRAVFVPDNRTGKQRVSIYYPHYVPLRVTTWRARFRDFGGFDVVMVGTVVVLVVLAVVTR